VIAATPEFGAARIIVLGDVMLDRYWSGLAARISPEAPVPVVKVKNSEERIGGAGNVALNIAKLGGKVTLLAVVGDDAEGVALRQLLEAEGVVCDFVVTKSARSICKLRIMAQHQQLIRLDFEDAPLDFDRDELVRRLQAHLPKNDVIVFSDYDKGTLAGVANCIVLAKQAGLKVLVDPKGSDYRRYAGADIITPNLSEFSAVVGGACASEQELLQKGRELLRQCRVETLLLTRGEAGMTLIGQAQEHSMPAQAKDVFDVTGAGDTVIAVMALGVAIALPLREAMYLSVLASGIVVGKLGTSTVSLQELTRAMHGDRESQYGIVSEEELVKLIGSAKAHNERIVMTNGCFDLLHAGHVTYLEQAKALGDRLIIAVNSDASVKKLKGESRPINGLQQRMIVLSALACVDWVVPFEEETPERLYCKLLPDVLVKGGDYSPEQVAGGDCVIKAGGEVKILQFVDGQSTTAMINKARNEG
jgi:D-beta-D-heptose 7-phosphate kinase/D-beta-D-heptose 1-phosphate adenosyltransferase